MSRDDRIGELLERILESDLSTEEACADCPELLDEVRTRLREVRAVEAQVELLFPTLAGNSALGFATLADDDGSLPSIRDHEVQAVLGRGGMGVVYQARHVKLNRTVAVKMLLAGSHAGRQETQRFMQEAESAASLKHPNIVQIYDYGEVGGQPYFTMEYVAGGSLAKKLAGTVQPVRDAAKMVAALGQAVFAAHKSGIIHRDLKPANILIAEDEVLKIGDFGLARRIDSDGGLTQTGLVLGTPNYMAPEQLLGHSAAIGPAVDIFALGAILYEMLVGRPPFLGTSFSDTQNRLLREEPTAPSRANPKVPRDLETICLKCLEKDPRNRYATAEDLAADLERFLRHEPIRARPLSPAARALRWVRRNPLPTILTATAVALVAFIIGNSLREHALSRSRQAERSRLTERFESGLQLVQEERFAEAKAILGKLGDGGNDDLRRRIDQTLADLKLVEDLDTVGIRRAMVTAGRDDAQVLRRKAAAEYAALFAQSGLRDSSDDLKTVVKRIESSDIKGTLVAALDDWAVCEPDASRRTSLLEITRTADPAPYGWSDQVRDPATWNEPEVLSHLASTAASQQVSVYLLRALGDRLADAGLDSIGFYRKVQREHTASFLANFALANALRKQDPEEAVRFYQAALAIRPYSLSTGNNLAVVLSDLGRTDEALALFRSTAARYPESSRVRYNLGLTLIALDRREEAITALREATKLEPDFAPAHDALDRLLTTSKVP